MRKQNPIKNPDTARCVTQQLAAFHRGREMSESQRRHIRESKTGSKNLAYGKPQPEEAKRKNAESNRRRALKYWAVKRGQS